MHVLALILFPLLVSPASAVTLVVSTVTAVPGDQVEVTVTLQTDGAAIDGLRVDLAFDGANIPIALRCNRFSNPPTVCTSDADCPSTFDFCAVRPACYVNPDINKGGTSFAFHGAIGCSGPACGTVRVWVLPTDYDAPIGDMSLLFTCKVNVSPSAVGGEYPLLLSDPVPFDLTGKKVPGEVVNGSIRVIVPPTAAPTDTATPTSTVTRTPTPTLLPPLCVGDCEGGLEVTVNDIVKMLNDALRDTEPTDCPAGDANRDARITIDEILLAENNVFNGCGITSPRLSY